MNLQPDDKVRITNKPNPREGIVRGFDGDGGVKVEVEPRQLTWFSFDHHDFEITEKRTPRLGELWYFTKPILGIGYVFQGGLDHEILQVRFRAGGQYPLAECDASELLWRDS